MLSPESAAVVRATLPAVGGALDEITTRFYGTMFAEQPELLDGLFNRGNQAGGEQRRALAGSIAGFPKALLAGPDTRPDALLARIAHKHAALGSPRTSTTSSTSTSSAPSATFWARPSPRTWPPPGTRCSG
jgi:nitric oxide dioxygenase